MSVRKLLIAATVLLAILGVAVAGLQLFASWELSRLVATAKLLKDAQSEFNDSEFQSATILVNKFLQRSTSDWERQQALQLRGRIRLALCDERKAMADFDAAIALGPKEYLPHWRKGALLRQQGKFHEAIAEYDLALPAVMARSGSLASSLLVERAMAYLELGDEQQANSDYLASLEKDSTVPLLQTHAAGGYGEVVLFKATDPTGEIEVQRDKQQQIQSVYIPENITSSNLESQLSALGSFAELRYLVAHSKHLTDRSLELFAESRKLHFVSIARTGVTDHGVARLMASGAVEILDVSETLVTGSGVESPNGTSILERLTMQNCPISVAGCKSISRNLNLQSLDLSGSTVPDDGLEFIGQLDQLKELMLDVTPIGTAGLRFIRSMKSLEALSIANTTDLMGCCENMNSQADLAEQNSNEISFADDAISLLASNSKLTYLNLRKRPISDSGVAQLAGLQDLRTLNLAETNVTDEGLELLSMLPSLSSLDLSRTQVHGRGLAALKHHNKLSSLRLEELQLDEGAIRNLNSRLTQLSLARSKLKGDDYRFLQQLTSLEYLDLSGSNVSNDSLKWISHLKDLCSLDLSKTAVSDIGIRELKSLSSLNSLDLAKTEVFGAGLLFLKSLPCMRNQGEGIYQRDTDGLYRSW